MISDKWTKSSRSCDSTNCIEARTRSGDIEIHDSKDPDGPILRVTRVEWQSFLAIAGGLMENE